MYPFPLVAVPTRTEDQQARSNSKQATDYPDCPPPRVVELDAEELQLHTIADSKQSDEPEHCSCETHQEKTAAQSLDGRL